MYEAINDSFHVFVGQELIDQDYPSQSSNGLVELGTFTDETVIVQVELLRPCSARSFGVYGMSHTVLESALSTISGDGLQETEGGLSGSFSAKQGDYLFLPIPSDENVFVTVNGEEVKAETVLDCFLAVPLMEGENQVDVSAFPPGMRTGLWLGVCGLAALVFLMLLLRKGYPPILRFVELPAKVVFFILCAGVFLAVYVAPVVIYLLR